MKFGIGYQHCAILAGLHLYLRRYKQFKSTIVKKKMRERERNHRKNMQLSTTSTRT
jgi:hypothetical protein